MGPADNLVGNHVVYPHAFFNQVDADGALYHIKGFDYKVNHYDSHGCKSCEGKGCGNDEHPDEYAVKKEGNESLSS